MKKVYFRIRNIFLICFMLSALASCSQMEHAGIHTGFSITMPQVSGSQGARYARGDVSFFKLYVNRMNVEAPVVDGVTLSPGETYTNYELIPDDYMIFVEAHKKVSGSASVMIGHGHEMVTVVPGKVSDVTIQIKLENGTAEKEHVTIKINLSTPEKLTLADYAGFSGTLTLFGISQNFYNLANKVYELEKKQNGNDAPENINVEDLTDKEVTDYINDYLSSIGFNSSDGIDSYLNLSQEDNYYERTFYNVEITEDTKNPVITVDDCIPGYYYAVLELSNGDQVIAAAYPASILDEQDISEYEDDEVVFEDDETSGNGVVSEEGGTISEDETPDNEQNSFEPEFTDYFKFEALKANETYTMELELPPLNDQTYKPTEISVVTESVLNIENLYLNDKTAYVQLQGYDNDDSNLSFNWFLNGSDITELNYFTQLALKALDESEGFDESEDFDGPKYYEGPDEYYGTGAHFNLNVTALKNDPVLVLGSNELKVYIYEGEKLIGTAVASFNFIPEDRPSV